MIEQKGKGKRFHGHGQQYGNWRGGGGGIRELNGNGKCNLKTNKNTPQSQNK